MDQRPGEKLRDRESRDGLTGVLMKDPAETQIISKMWERRKGALFLCTVNYMKQVNEQYGHLMGDECLKQAARILSYMICADDILGRRSGDQFMIYMPDCRDERQAEETQKRFYNRFRTSGGKVGGKISLSATVVWALQTPSDSWPDLLARADGEMEREISDMEITWKQSRRSKDRYIRDVKQVRKELGEQIRKLGAYCQDYETFKGIYRFLARGIIRSGQKACVILITVVNEEGGSPRLSEKDTLMEQLGNQIEAALRIGDVYTRYSSSQYLLLVINTTEREADKIAERIREQFLASREGNDVLIHNCYEVQPTRINKKTNGEDACGGPGEAARE